MSNYAEQGKPWPDESTDLRTTAQLRLAGLSESLYSSSCPSKDTQSRVPRAMSRQLSEISKKEIPQFLGTMCQCSVICTVKCFPMFQFVPITSYPISGHH